VDMSRHLKQWINDAELRRRGGRYVGVVVAVVEEVVRNPCGSNSPGPASPPHGDSGTGSRRTPALDRERAQHRSMADASNSARFSLTQCGPEEHVGGSKSISGDVALTRIRQRHTCCLCSCRW
jgi:hypothetical protein